MTYNKQQYINYDNQTNTLRYQIHENLNIIEHIENLKDGRCPFQILLQMT